MKSARTSIVLSADEKRIINAFRTADRRGRRTITVTATRQAEIYPRAGKRPELIEAPGCPQ